MQQLIKSYRTKLIIHYINAVTKSLRTDFISCQEIFHKNSVARLYICIVIINIKNIYVNILIVSTLSVAIMESIRVKLKWNI